MESIMGRGKPVVLAALGNPYLLRNFPSAAAYFVTFSTVAPSETATARALWGEIGFHGHMPVSIPSFAKIGDGIQLEAARSSIPGGISPSGGGRGESPRYTK
jgi:beta-N-acetylhexosaminidase